MITKLEKAKEECGVQVCHLQCMQLSYITGKKQSIGVIKIKNTSGNPFATIISNLIMMGKRMQINYLSARSNNLG